MPLKRESIEAGNNARSYLYIQTKQILHLGKETNWDWRIMAKH